jgi:hypothetical protein
VGEERGGKETDGCPLTDHRSSTSVNSVKLGAPCNVFMSPTFGTFIVH